MTKLNLTDKDTGVKLYYGERPGNLTIQKGFNGFYIDLDKRQRRELALSILAEDYDLRFYPGPRQTRRIDMVEKLPPLPVIKVGEYYRFPGEADMAEPWRYSPVAKVVKADSPQYIVLETISGEQTGWGDVRALGEPLKVTEQVEWVVEEGDKIEEG